MDFFERIYGAIGAYIVFAPWWVWLYAGLILLALIPFALAQHAHDGEVGRFYQSWLRPDIRVAGNRTQSCCNQMDCAPANFRKVGGQWEGFHSQFGQWYRIPENLFEHNQDDPRESPDARGHLCVLKSQGKVLCAVMASEG